ncbi:MAG: carboxylesterase family protein [Pseudomonadota bacterium]
MRTTLLLATGVILLLSACGPTPTGVVDAPAGPISGVRSDATQFYRGIPYAQAPVGDLRWRAPEPLPAWRETLAAQEFGPACWQPTNSGNEQFLERLTEGAGMGGFTQWLLTSFAGLAELEVSEDCLTLNIAMPQGAKNLPVMFWIHGGGHQFGSGGGPYESASLAAQGVVLVSINYRLGLYGFFAHPELAAEDPHGSTGNYGTLDQIAALQWVQDNIAAFGGDPENVTIFGESAGGHSVGQLMASPVARGLFHRAIAQSGTGFYQFQATDADYERVSGFAAGRDLARRAGVAGEDEIDGLRDLSTEDLAPLATDPELSETFHPQIDGYVLPRSTAQIFTEGAQAAIPLMVGSNADEGSVLYYFGLPPVDGSTNPPPTTVAEWEAMLRDSFGVNAEAVNSHYRVDTDQDVVKAAEQLMGDTWFGRHAFYMAHKHGASGLPAYLYFYERHPPTEAQTIGASHALELAHVFGGFIPMWPWDERDDELSSQMQTYWVNFAATGDPNRDGLPAWPTFDGLAPQEMSFGHERTVANPVARLQRYLAMQAQFDQRVAAATIGMEGGSGQ